MRRGYQDKFATIVAIFLDGSGIRRIDVEGRSGE